MSLQEIQYCLSYPLVLTRRCGNWCGYCRFPHGPSRPLPSIKRLRSKIRHAVNQGAVQLELISGEDLNTLDDVKKTLSYYGFESYEEYLGHVLKIPDQSALTGHAPHQLFPLLNVGNLEKEDLEKMRPDLCAVQVLLESMDAEVQSGPHAQAPAKDPERRLETILNCGRLSIPVSTGMMVGLGENDISQIQLCEIISQAHERYQHIQSFEIQTFWPKPGTPMENEPEVGDDDLLSTVMLARELLPDDISILVKAQEHMHLIKDLLEAGVNDLGSISIRPNLSDPDADWQNVLKEAQRVCDEEDYSLKPRLPIHSRFFDTKHYPGRPPQNLQSALDNLSQFSVPADQSAPGAST